MSNCLATEPKEKQCEQWSARNMTDPPSMYVQNCKGKPKDDECKEMQQICLRRGGDAEDCSID